MEVKDSKDTNIFIIDAIMGSGKSTAAINKINKCEDRFIYVTPYLDEVDRIVSQVNAKKVYAPDDNYGSKLKSMLRLINQGKNIVTTHALFRKLKSELKDKLKEKEYILILDEVFDVVEDVYLSKSDFDFIIGSNLARIEGGILKWNDSEYSGIFTNIKEACETGTVIVYKDNHLMWSFPIDIFTSFKEVYILTYMFKAQIQRMYYDFTGIKYKIMGVWFDKCVDGSIDTSTCEFSDNIAIPKYVYSIKNKIHIIDDDRLNNLGIPLDKENPFSRSWFDRAIKEKNIMSRIRNNLLNYFRRKCDGANASNTLWTTYKDAFPYLKGSGLSRNFLQLRARATNEYRDRKYLAYCVNLFMHPCYKHFFGERKIKVYEDEYALSEMIQWVWRSAIRMGEDIYIYIPSDRMRSLFKQWLNNLDGSSNKPIKYSRVTSVKKINKNKGKRKASKNKK